MLMDLPGVERVETGHGVALQETVAACRGAVHGGEARHRVHVRAGTEHWHFRASPETALWEPVHQGELWLPGPVSIIPAGAYPAGPDVQAVLRQAGAGPRRIAPDAAYGRLAGTVVAEITAAYRRGLDAAAAGKAPLDYPLAHASTHSIMQAAETYAAAAAHHLHRESMPDRAGLPGGPEPEPG